MSEQVLQLDVNVYLPRTVQICSRLRFVLVVFVFLDGLVNDWFFLLNINISDVILILYFLYLFQPSSRLV